MQEALRKAGIEHECEFELKEESHYYQCLSCNKDCDTNLYANTTLGACCEAFKNNPASRFMRR